MIKVVFLSDTHNRHKHIKMFQDHNDLGEDKEPMSGDLIIHSGDATMGGKHSEVKHFIEWYGKLNFTHKIFVAGNHDWLFEDVPATAEQICKDNGVTYLNDSEVTLTFEEHPDDDAELKTEEERNSGKIQRKLRIWGSPVTPWFLDWAFNRGRTLEESAIKNIKHIWEHWKLIPEGIDILVTHGPPYGILDNTPRGEKVGCQLLMQKILDIKPKYHAFGHIHCEYGERYFNGTKFINASICDERYAPSNLPVVIEI